METTRFNKLRTIIPAVALVTAGTLALGACGGDDGRPESSRVTTTTTKDPDPELHVTYYDNGSRQMHFENTLGYLGTIVDMCDGYDLLEQAGGELGYTGMPGSAPERSVNHPACADGKLTPEDFTRTK